MCLGQTTVKINDGDRYELDFLGQKFSYVAKATPNGIVLVHDSKTPLGYPLGALPVAKMHNYKFSRCEQ